MTSPRLQPAFWRHDAYTLARLANCIRAIVHELGPKLQPGDRVIDLGAGEAPYRRLFDALACEYLCCDINEGAPVRLVSGEITPLDAASAGLVVSFQVLEHVWDLDWYLGEAHRLMHDDGALLLSTHGVWLHHPHPTDFRRWTREGLVAELESRGFTIHEVHALVGPLAWTTQFRALGFSQLLQRLPVLGAPLAAIVCAAMNLRMRLEDAVTPQPWIDNNAAVYVVLAHKKAC